MNLINKFRKIPKMSFRTISPYPGPLSYYFRLLGSLLYGNHPKPDFGRVERDPLAQGPTYVGTTTLLET